MASTGHNELMHNCSLVLSPPYSTVFLLSGLCIQLVLLTRATLPSPDNNAKRPHVGQRWIPQPPGDKIPFRMAHASPNKETHYTSKSRVTNPHLCICTAASYSHKLINLMQHFACNNNPITVYVDWFLDVLIIINQSGIKENSFEVLIQSPMTP